MYSSSAFKILGIDPTNDGRVIRAAYVRLARIYHPDRFVGMPDDVRTEAEIRMKEATAAYQELRTLKRTSNKAAESETPSLRDDVWERAKRARDTVDAIKAEQERSRKRWLVWEELERQARDRADWEARMAAQLADDSPRVREVRLKQQTDETDGSASSTLSRRLEAARGNKRDALAPARNDTA
jgi:curved DNA-binding protein CbpA